MIKQYFDVNGKLITIGASVTHMIDKWIRFVVGYDGDQLIVFCISGQYKKIGCDDLVVLPSLREQSR